MIKIMSKVWWNFQKYLIDKKHFKIYLFFVKIKLMNRTIYELF